MKKRLFDTFQNNIHCHWKVDRLTFIFVPIFNFQRYTEISHPHAKIFLHKHENLSLIMSFEETLKEFSTFTFKILKKLMTQRQDWITHTTVVVEQNYWTSNSSEERHRSSTTDDQTFVLAEEGSGRKFKIEEILWVVNCLKIFWLIKSHSSAFIISKLESETLETEWLFSHTSLCVIIN